MNKDLKHRFNSVDFLIIMLCLCGILTLVLRSNLSRAIGLEDIGSPTEYTLLVPSLDSEKAALFHAGEVLTHPDTGEVLGTVRTVRRENAVLYTLGEDRLVRAAIDTSSFHLTLTVQGNGKDTERGFLLNGSYYAAPGDSLTICPEGESEFTATVLPSPKKG